MNKKNKNYIIPAIIFSIILHFSYFFIPQIKGSNFVGKKENYITLLEINEKVIEKEKKEETKKSKEKVEEKKEIIKNEQNNLENEYKMTNVQVTNIENIEEEVKYSDNEGKGKQEEIFYGVWEADKLPRFIRRVDPEYPHQAVFNKITGKVFVNVWLNDKGKIVKIEFLNKPGYGIEEAIEKALYKSEFSPAFKNGVPINVIIRIPYVFELED